jgi:hypothetical protein
LSVLEHTANKHDAHNLPPPFEANSQSAQANKSALFVLSAQINEHKKQEAARSCLEQLPGLIYHPDSDSLAALEKLYTDARRGDTDKHRAIAGTDARRDDTDMHGAVVGVHQLTQTCALLIRNDRQALAQRNQVDHVFSDIAENAVLLLRGRTGLAITLGTYALNHIRPATSIANMALGAGTGIVEGGAFRAGLHIAGRATHHAEVTVMRYVNEALHPRLHAAGNYCLNVIKSRQMPTLLPAIEDKPFIDLLPETFIYRPPASAAEAFGVVSQLVECTPHAADTGQLLMAAHNVQFGNIEKALLYHRAYEYMFSRAHLIFLEEVDPDFCRAAAGAIDYKWYASRVNSRGQGLGFLLHPRLEVIGPPVTLESIADVHHIPDLRPGFMLHLKDTHSGVQLDALAVHLKSMRGGPYTHGVRYAQTTALAKLVSDHPTIVGGDWNFFLNQHEREMAPLQHAGFQLVDPESNLPTQEFGGRLDGFMTRNMPCTFSNCETFNFWQCLPNRSFSDHGMLRVRMDVGN